MGNRILWGYCGNIVGKTEVNLSFVIQSAETDFSIVYYNCDTMTETGAEMFRFFLSCYIEKLLKTELLYGLRKIKGRRLKRWLGI